MANNRIVVTPDTLQDRASKIRGYKAKQEEIMSRMTNLMNSLSTVWRGGAQDVLLVKYINMRPLVNSFQESINEYAILAEDTASRFEKLENKLTDEIANTHSMYASTIHAFNSSQNQQYESAKSTCERELSAAVAAAETAAKVRDEVNRTIAQAPNSTANGAVQTVPTPTTTPNTSFVPNQIYKSPKGNATGYGMTYYGQGTYAEDYSTANFTSSSGKSYGSSSACGICANAMLLSYFGANVKPGDLIEANAGSKSWDGSGVQKVMNNNGISMKIDAQRSKGATSDQIASALDSAIDKFNADPAHNGPVFVGTNLASGNHYVLVVGKTNDGKYIIVDPGQGPGGRTTTTLEHIKMVVSTSKK